MLLWLALSLVLGLGAIAVPMQWPGTTLAVTLYKAHLLSLGGWGGYWLDRGLFPYDRPHTHLDFEEWPGETPADDLPECAPYVQVATSAFAVSMLRRALIVTGCLICVGLRA